jgi:integrase
VRVFLGRDANGKQEILSKTVTGTKEDARSWGYERQRERSRPGGVEAARLTVAELLDSLVLDYKVNRKDVAWCELLVRVHLKPYFGGMLAAKLGTDHTRKYIAHCQAEGLANATINRHLALLRRAFNLGAKDDPPKVERAPYIPTLQENNTRAGFFTDAEYTAMLRELPEHLKPILTFGYYTGCRRGEILSLHWSQVDLDNRLVRLEPGTTKNKQARSIPLELTPQLYESLKMQRAIREARHPGSPWVFFYHDSGEPVRDIRGAWEAASKAAGLWDKESGRATRLFHDLRRTGVRNLVRAGVSEKVAMRISGHLTRAVFDRYDITSEADLKDAGRKVTQYFAELRERGASEAAAKSDTMVTQADSKRVQ